MGGGGMAGMLGQMVLSFLDKGNIAEGLSDAKDKFGGLDKAGGGMFEIALGMGKKILDGVMPDFLMKKKEENPFNMADFAGAFGSGGTQQWAPLAAMALQMAGISASQLPRFLALMAAESGGNPMAINNYDSNAAMGQASRGLMQVIPSTFAAYHVPGTSNNIFDPLANMAAAANYIKHVYGGNVPGSPYAMGTNNASRGWHLVGENGPEMRYFRGGERVANARKTYGELGKANHGGGCVFEKGAFQIDARGATVEAVREMETNLLPKLRLAVQAGTGKKG
jgi:SLT domain-containing protein